MKEENKKNSKNRRKLRLLIYFIIALIILLLSLFGCKTCNDNKYRKILNNLPKINEEGYWIDKDNNKLTDIKSSNKNINSFEYYKTKDNNYPDSVAKFVKDYNSNNLKKFKIDFLNKDNSIYKSKEYNFLEKLEFPQDPFEEGLIFKGWNILNNIENENKLFTKNNKVIVDDNYTFKPVFNKIEEPIKDKFKLEFIVDEQLYKVIEVKKGEIVGAVSAPEKEGYIYQGWYDEFDNKFEPEKVIINKDYILKAKYYNKKPAEELNKYVVNIYDHNHILISSSKHKVDSVIELKRFTKDYVYEYYYDEDSSIDKFESIKDENYFNYVVTKDVNLIPKGHKKFIKFVSGSDEINVVNSNNEEIEGGKINVVTGENIEFAKVVKADFYRLNKIVWQIDNNGVKQDFNDTVYNYNYDLTLYYKDDPNMFSDVYKIKELEDHIEITGLNDNYKTIPDFNLNIPSIINDKEVTTVGGFYSLTNINEVILPPTVKTIKKYCFRDSSITKINLEESSVNNIELYAFSGCHNLTKIKLPPSINVIKEGLFFRM
ncbi:MAG: leucine-rich repeat protein [Bacillales bacterium]